MPFPPRAIACAALMLSSSLGSAAVMPVNIVQNPGFEEGSKHWKYAHFSFVPNPLWARTGPGVARLTYCDRANCIETLNLGAYVSQLLSTRPGDVYDLSFWVRSFSGESRLSVFWDGSMLTATGTPNGPMRRYSFSGLTASASATMLQVHGYNSINQHMSFDDFSVVKRNAIMPQMPDPPLQPVNEPGIYALILLALGAMVMALRRPIV